MKRVLLTRCRRWQSSIEPVSLKWWKKPPADNVLMRGHPSRPELRTCAGWRQTNPAASRSAQHKRRRVAQGHFAAGRDGVASRYTALARSKCSLSTKMPTSRRNMRCGAVGDSVSTWIDLNVRLWMTVRLRRLPVDAGLLDLSRSWAWQGPSAIHEESALGVGTRISGSGV